VLSRILCSKSLPTHPSDPIEINKKQHYSTIETIVVDGAVTPNVVARLMGLDSMPELEFSSEFHQKFTNSIPRSKSMDSEDFRGETEEMQGQHRRVKTSVSFRETPDFFELEDDDFFILNFDKREEDAKLGESESVSRNDSSQSNESFAERNVGLKRRDYKKHENIEMLKRICRLAEAEVNNSNWKYRKLLKDDELEDTALDFSQGIFDQLVSELIDQLLEIECQDI
uniref:DUF3741 domain-containing protein n=1 Tax=Chenopodium quinoa TaxID=63459 RepID=A0A803KRH5_CHEQI